MGVSRDGRRMPIEYYSIGSGNPEALIGFLINGYTTLTLGICFFFREHSGTGPGRLKIIPIAVKDGKSATLSFMQQGVTSLCSDVLIFVTTELGPAV